jgi:hypothetical protein
MRLSTCASAALAASLVLALIAPVALAQSGQLGLGPFPAVRIKPKGFLFDDVVPAIPRTVAVAGGWQESDALVSCQPLIIPRLDPPDRSTLARHFKFRES